MMLFAVFAVASWGQTTQTIQVSADADSPEHVYYMKNGNGRWMTGTTGPTETWANKAQFAFYEVTDTADAYKIYCVTSNKWLSYAKAGSYANQVGFVQLVDSKEKAESWHFAIQDGRNDIGNVYCFAPYNSTGVAAKYMNWYQGAGANPNDNANITVGLWQQDATADNGSCWIIADVDLADYTHEQKMVRIKNTTTGLYMTIASPDGTNIDAGGVQLGDKIATTGTDCLNQVFYLKSTGNDAVCKIQSVSPNGYYLQWFGAWGYKASSVDAEDAKHTIEAVDDYYLLHTTKGYVGTNDGATAAGSPMYSNHDTSKRNIKWTFEPLSEEEVANVAQQKIKSVQAEYAAWVAQSVGERFGQYYVPEVNAEALVAAENELGNAGTVEEARAALNKCKEQYSLNGPTVGSYYRIKNTAMGLYLGIDGYTLNMKHKEVTDANTGDDDPALIWKYEQDGDKYYLKNVYAGLYPQNIPGGQGNTAKIGTGKDKAFTYAIHANPTETDDTKWNIFFGGTQVNCEGSTNNVGNVNYWYGDNAHYYIYEVEAPEDEFASMCAEWYADNPKDDETVPAKISVDENATVIISPNEFAAPQDINNVIDVYGSKINMAAGNVTQESIWNLYEALTAWSIVRTYVDAVNTNGELISIAYTPRVEWGTIILPINWAKPEGWTLNTCAETEGNVLTLVENASGKKNKPYVIQVEEEKLGTTYQLIGYSNGAETTNQTVGLLTGVLEDSHKVPAGSYILSKYNDKIGFYRVAEDADYDAVKYRCYLTLPASEARYGAFFFEGGEETGIDNVADAEAKNYNGTVYNMAGQRLNGLQKGLNIVNGKIVLK